MKVGDLVKDDDQDLGIVIGFYEDPADGYEYVRVRWLTVDVPEGLESVPSDTLEVVCE